MKKQKIIYYSDLYNDEFFNANYKIKSINKNYKYINNSVFYKFLSFVVYRLIATPLAFVYSKIFKRIKFVNVKILKQFKKQGYFIYANHTHALSDALTPTVILFSKKVYAIVNAENVSIPVIGGATKMLGALPLNQDLEGTKNLINAIQTRLKQNSAILVYPEAHIWPYYTSIRPFKATSFKYPVKFNVPVFCFTTTYQKTKRGKLKMVIYVDGPFEVSNEKSINEKAESLKEQVYNCMLIRSLNSNYEKIKYVKKDENYEPII